MFEEAEERTQGYIEEFIDMSRPFASNVSNLSFPEGVPFTRKKGKVRDIYYTSDFIVIVATDRLSAFDRNLAAIPFKGQILNFISSWWFEKTKSFVPNHLLASPHPNVVICKKCNVFPVEFVVRGYITGSTNTSMWTNYNKGMRNYCGHQLPEGLRKNQKLESALLTPTTKDDKHDELISAHEVVRSGRMTQEEWDRCSAYALDLFRFSQTEALARGVILVDTKYEFGREETTGEILLVDEVQTPDSSRYWIAASYEERMARNEEPENIDKEFFRKWFVQHCDPYNDETLPDPPAHLINELSRRYALLQEVITGEPLQRQSYQTLETDMNAAVASYFESERGSCS